MDSAWCIPCKLFARTTNTTPVMMAPAPTQASAFTVSFWGVGITAEELYFCLRS
jgi:hypothetical protein